LIEAETAKSSLPINGATLVMLPVPIVLPIAVASRSVNWRVVVKCRRVFALDDFDDWQAIFGTPALAPRFSRSVQSKR